MSLYANAEQEKPTICGTKAADVLAKFLADVRINFPADKHNANPPTILLHSHLLCAQRGKELEFVGATHDFIAPINIKFCSICCHLAGFPTSYHDTQIAHQFGGWGGPRELKMLPIEMPRPHSYSTSIDTIGLSCTIWPQYATWQTKYYNLLAEFVGIGHPAIVEPVARLQNAWRRRLPT